MFRKSEPAASAQPQKKLGEILLEDEVITQEQLQKALEKQRENGGFLGQVLVEEKIISQDTLISYLAKQCQIPHLSLLNYRISEDALAQVPRELCVKHYVLPVDKMGRILTLAMVDPLNTEALDEIKKYCPNLRIKPVLCSWEHFQATVKQLFAHEAEKPDNLTESYAQLQAKAMPPKKGGDETVDKAQGATVTSTDTSQTDQTATVEDHTETVESQTQAVSAPSGKPAAAPEKSPATPPMQSHASDFNEAMQLLQERIASVMESTMVGMAEQFKTLIERSEAEKKQDVETLAEALRESVAAAVAAAQGAQPASDANLTEVAANTLGTIAGDSSSQGEQLSAITEAMLQFMEAEKNMHAEKQGQLEQIAQAALDSVRQTAQFIEAQAVAENNRNDMLRHRQAKHASVAPFFSSSGNAAPVDAPEYLEEDDRVRNALTSEYPLETLTFDNFFLGEANGFTVKLAREVAANPGGKYNPLFLYGKVGLGKTHLISAIGNANISTKDEAKKGLPRRIGYVSASHFARRLSAAVADNALEQFRDNYCHWDMLILDDIQFLGGRVEAQEEFFHIFNVLQQQGRQIIIAGDKAPDRLGMLEQRLVSRFASGIVVDLKPPEWETRMKILRYHVERDQTKVPEEVLSLIAMRVPDDIRKMTGALHKIIAFSRLEGDKITVEDAQKILSHLGVDEAA